MATAKLMKILCLMPFGRDINDVVKVLQAVQELVDIEEREAVVDEATIGGDHFLVCYEVLSDE